MSPLLILGVPLFSIFWSLYWLVVRPARKQRRAAALAPRLPEGFVPPSAALAAPEPKAPRDTSRTYPRPARSRSKLNRVCPVCGMEDPGNLDGKVLGWPAHRSCAEWLGDWKPPRYVPPPPYRPTGSVIAVAVTNSPGAQVSVNSLHAPFTPEQVETSAMVANGLVSLDEARERIAAAFSVPPLVLGDTWSVAGDRQPLQVTGDGLYRPLGELTFGDRHLYSVTEQRLKPPGVPLMFCDCPCGREFIGTEEWLNRELTLHRGSGECPAFR